MVLITQSDHRSKIVSSDSGKSDRNYEMTKMEYRGSERNFCLATDYRKKSQNAIILLIEGIMISSEISITILYIVPRDNKPTFLTHI